jgi:cyanophycin synthetase
MGNMYDHIILCDSSPRQRKIGETAELVRKGILSTGFPKNNIEMVLEEHAAILVALKMAKEGDLIVIQADDLNRAIIDVLEYKENMLAKSKKRA